MSESATNPDAAILATLAKLEASAKFLQSEFFMARLLEGQRVAAIQVSSPWLDRNAAAAYAYCSVAEVDRAANEGIITRHQRGGSPMFEKVEIDEAIRNGAWMPAVSGKRKAREAVLS